MTSCVPASIRPVPVIVDGVPEHTVATSSVTTISTAPSAKTWTVIVWVPPSASLVEIQVPSNGLRGSLAGVRSDPRSRANPIAARANTAMPRTPAATRRFRCLRSRRRVSRSKSPGSRSTVRLSRSSSSSTLDIFDPHHSTEGLATLARQGPDRRGLDPKRVSGLLGGEPEHLGEHERGPLARRERRQDPPNGLPIVGVGEVVVSGRQAHGSADRERGAAGPPAEQVHGRPVQVPDPILPPTHPT